MGHPNNLAIADVGHPPLENHRALDSGAQPLSTTVKDV